MSDHVAEPPYLWNHHTLAAWLEAKAKELPVGLTTHRAIWNLCAKSLRTFEVAEHFKRMQS